jgi:RING finger protein 113A
LVANICPSFRYGHNCKFLHDRGDYKSGWEIDQEWKRTGGGQKEENYEIESSGEEDALPFACFICKRSFVNPVVTKCGHYFCESCALAQEKKKKRCFICNEPTAGIFNQPKALIAKLAQREATSEKQAEEVE